MIIDTNNKHKIVGQQNYISFITITSGQIFRYCSIKSSSYQQVIHQKKNNDSVIALSETLSKIRCRGSLS